MLELRNITKDYPAGSGTVHALKGIDLRFRKSEFVSILGPSGCGKTTLLNLIGGLDQYTSGDLIINGRSTKDFKDRDWDAYRNHSIGFVFQSYNLIPHQSVLQNVELALTLSGVPKAERRRRAKEALTQVGLAEQMYKRPGEMSGGQMQRVAIARAIVNNPDIVLADEPTGALDTQTSIQVMEILKEISRDRLVIMVTHNPDLATAFSTRIIRMLDGLLTDDTEPVTEEEIAQDTAALQQLQAEQAGKKPPKKPSMSLATSFGLSLKNLFTKKGRTALTSFAGSIGIIGIALIMAVSQGTKAYIDAMQEDTLSSYPLTIEAEHAELGLLMQTLMGSASEAPKHDLDAVYSRTVMYELLNAVTNMKVTKNDLTTFKKFIEAERSNPNSKSGLYGAVSGVQYSYDLDLLIYTQNVDGTVIRSDTDELLQELVMEYMGVDPSALAGSGLMGSSGLPMMGGSELWQEMLPGDNGDPINPVLKDQYDCIAGDWPEAYNEVVLVLNENNELSDMTLYALGLKSKDEIDKVLQAVLHHEEVSVDTQKWSYEEICNREFRLVLNSDCYVYSDALDMYADLRTTDAGLRYLYNNAIPLKVKGIIRPSKDAVSSMLTGSIAYTNLLTQYVVERSQSSAALSAQLADPSRDIFTGLPFADDTGTLTDSAKEAALRAYVSGLTDTRKAETYVEIHSIPTEAELQMLLAQLMQPFQDRASIEEAFVAALVQEMGMDEQRVRTYVSSMSEEDLMSLFTQMMTEQARAMYAMQTEQALSAMSTEEKAQALDAELAQYTTEQCAQYYDVVMHFSDSTYEDNLKTLGYVALDTPSVISLYASSFADKDKIVAAIDEYNRNADPETRIRYTDYIGLMMSSVTLIINAITYVLIAFVSVSLVVSAIMIGVITLISVQERTKEIGILRAIGASKHNVSSLFNAETIIVGFTAGALGVLVTYLLCIPINLILHALTDISNLSAMLSPVAAVGLVLLSMLLTAIAGFIPSRSAAKKDPVVALRTE